MIMIRRLGVSSLVRVELCESIPSHSAWKQKRPSCLSTTAPDSIGFISPWILFSQADRHGDSSWASWSAQAKDASDRNVMMFVIQSQFMNVDTAGGQLCAHYYFSAIFMFCLSLIINSTQQHFSAAYQRWMSVPPKGWLHNTALQWHFQHLLSP